MLCSVCGRGPMKDGVAIFRVNPQGESPVWNCKDCISAQDELKLDPAVQRLTDIIGGINKPEE